MRKAISALYLLGAIVLFVAAAGNTTTHRGGPGGPPCWPCSEGSRATR